MASARIARNRLVMSTCAGRARRGTWRSRRWRGRGRTRAPSAPRAGRTRRRRCRPGSARRRRRTTCGPAPDFELASDTGETVKLSSLRGKPVVLYFYPKDDTPGCTKQACGIRDAWGDFQRAGAVVLGLSPDGEASHAKFRAKYDLPFTL